MSEYNPQHDVSTSLTQSGIPLIAVPISEPPPEEQPPKEEENGDKKKRKRAKIDGDGELTLHQLGSSTSIPEPSPLSETNGPLMQANFVGQEGGDQLGVPPIRVADGERYAEITEYLKLPQQDAAKRLGIPISTLSKRWKEVVRNGRKWPYRTVRKLDTEIMTLLHNVPDGGSLPKELEQQLAELLAKRNKALQPVVIRI